LRDQFFRKLVIEIRNLHSEQQRLQAKTFTESLAGC